MVSSPTKTGRLEEAKSISTKSGHEEFIAYLLVLMMEIIKSAASAPDSQATN